LYLVAFAALVNINVRRQTQGCIQIIDTVAHTELQYPAHSAFRAVGPRRKQLRSTGIHCPLPTTRGDGYCPPPRPTGV